MKLSAEQIVAVLTAEYATADILVEDARKSIEARMSELRKEYLSNYARKLARIEWLTQHLNDRDSLFCDEIAKRKGTK